MGTLWIHSVTIDTRHIQTTPQQHSLFIAIKGDSFDGHCFLNKAQTLGVSVAVIDDENLIQIQSKSEQKKVTIPLLLVSNTQHALAQIAALVRQKSKAVSIAVTGSSGKTTVKEMIACILTLKGKTFATQGNYNNAIGVPLSLLHLKKETEYAVFELGASQKGDIALTRALVCPKVALVNNISSAHLEGFGSLSNVAKAKSEIYEQLPFDGVAVINLNDSFSSEYCHQITSKKITYTSLPDLYTFADIYAQNIRITKEKKAIFQLCYRDEKLWVHLSLIGKHNVMNALAAAACCVALNISLKMVVKGLESVKPVNGRLQIHPLTDTLLIIDDTYNANSDSVKAAIRLLAEYDSTTFFIFGDMAELGLATKKLHREIGEYAKKYHIDHLYTCGSLTQLTQQAFQKNNSLSTSQHFTKQSDLIEHLCLLIHPKQQELLHDIKSPQTLLVKGARCSKMEKVVDALIHMKSIQ
jgi:UDP-N-acetylmuramoyl-tripeptide--D-alanyl-D-alanine ligase